MRQKRNLTARFIEPAGHQLKAIALWDRGACAGGGSHRSERILRTDKVCDEDPFGGDLLDKVRSANEEWVCEHCGAKAMTEEVHMAGAYTDYYDTASGRPEPGDMFYRDYHQIEPGKCYHHDNCDGKHLIAILPNGVRWDIDSRANNCTKPKDRMHRCWVRDGVPPKITAGKNGNTCSAGAGSIVAGDWHGFLRNGEFQEC